jgi:large subunit ribosomal protein L14e
LIDGPTTGVPRQSFPYRNMVLTPYTLAALPRGAGTGAIRKALEKADVAAKWESSSWAKKLAARDQRKKQNDFERFEIGLLKRQRRDLVSRAWFREMRESYLIAIFWGALQVRKATAKEKKAATA